MSAPVRVRFAPSPTGLLHVGGLRTALYNYLLARQTGGAFVLRIEDTDQARFVEGAEADILDSLAWAGLDVDEGPHVGGPVGPYRQSERRAHYDAAIRHLLDAGHAYVAFDTPEALDALRGDSGTVAYDASTRGQMTNALTLGPNETARRVAAGEPHVVRLHVVPGETVAFQDAVRGTVSFATESVDDQVLLKSDGLPTYHLANVVDDHAMGITDVIRGEEWLPSTPKHLLLYRAFGWTPPAFAHLPLILSPTGGKLSKRAADRAGIPVSVRDYRAAGYEPEALLNFLALLGWNPGDERERFTLAELVEAFDPARIGKSGVQFSLDKLNWFNGAVLRELSPEALAERARPAVEAAHGAVDADYLAAAAGLLRERLTFAHDLADASYLFGDVTVYDPAAVAKRWQPDSADAVRLYADRLAAEPTFSAGVAEGVLRDLAESQGVGFGALVHPVRLAVTGVAAGAGLFETMEVLGRETCLARLHRAADALGA